MGDTDRLLDYRELVGEVRRLCSQGQTGSVFITTSDNHAVRFALQDGTIIAVSFRQQTGLSALVAIQRIGRGRLKYSEEVLHRQPQPDLPPTHEVLLMLNGESVDPAEPPAQAPPPAAREELARSRGIIEAELAEYLGPMAELVCADHLATASSVNDLVEQLAREIHDAVKAGRFKARVRERLAAIPRRS